MNLDNWRLKPSFLITKTAAQPRDTTTYKVLARDKMRLQHPIWLVEILTDSDLAPLAKFQAIFSPLSMKKP